jgi:DNA phosphorothioation-dependent restriction protein DptH
MVVSNERANESSWEWEPHMDAGIVTPLHPALLDMMNHQNSYLCNSFSYYASRLLEDSNRKAFAEKKWDQVVDLAAIKWPIIGTLSGFYQSVDTNVSSFGYIHVYWSMPGAHFFSQCPLLLEYEKMKTKKLQILSFQRN